MARLALGDIVYFQSAYRTHGAHLVVTKINRKSFSATEDQNSYKPGTDWIMPQHPGRRLARRTTLKTTPYVTDEWFTLGDHGEML